MNTIPLFLTATVLFGLGCWFSYRWYARKYFPWHKWDTSRDVQSDPQEQGGAEGISDWFQANKGEMGKFEKFPLTDLNKAKIDRVMQTLKNEWTYIRDEDGKDFEPVDIKTRSGDCEDHARVAKFMLQKEGLPESCMTLALCVDPRFGLHCILWLTTSEGVYILSVLEDWAIPFDKFICSQWQICGADGWLHGVKE